MSKILFLTFNDYPGGIFAGQVTDVCSFLKSQGNEVGLLSFVSLRTYFSSRSEIRKLFPAAHVAFMNPGVVNWRKNYSRLARYIRRLKPDTIIARGPFAVNLALDARRNHLVKRVVFDGRGAYTAEFNEYHVAGSSVLNTEIRSLEQRAVKESDYRIAVSAALVDYWRKEFDYQEQLHVVIPCTLRKAAVQSAAASGVRKRFGFSDDDVVIVYSGSFAGWQSFGLLDTHGKEIIERNSNVKFLILAPDTGTLQLQKQYPEKVVVTWLSASEVQPVLSACDYGWLVRENTVTNKVASPVKFAEYLAAGLDVLISPQLGDFTDFVRQQNCGIVVEGEYPQLKKRSNSTAERNKKLADQFFRKELFTEQYRKISG